MPPFDGYSPELELHETQNGSFQFKSTSPDHANSKAISNQVQLIKREDKYFMLTPTGLEWPVIERDGKKFVQSLSCSTSAAFVMRHWFGIAIDLYGGAARMRERLSNGNPGGEAPAAVIDY